MTQYTTLHTALSNHLLIAFLNAQAAFVGEWTTQMERTRAQISRLSRHPSQRNLARRLDRNRKSELRQRRRRIQDPMIQELETGALRDALIIMKKLGISSNRTSTLTLGSMDRDAFSTLIQVSFRTDRIQRHNARKSPFFN